MSSSTAPRYSKPHLPYGQQLALLNERGLTYLDQAAAIRALRSIGYYRFSAYTYVFREQAPPMQAGRPSRLDTFVAGATFEDAIKLYRFDHKLRQTLLDGLHEVEVGLRAQLGHYVGLAHPYAHLNPQHLDANACSEKRAFGGETTADDAHTEWLKMYERQKYDARSEDYVKHFDQKYAGDMPIWVATEFMTFGCITYLYSLIADKEARKIADNLAIKDRTVVHKYLKALNVLRNHCAHNSRVWNRSTVYPPVRPPRNVTHQRIHHLREADNNRIYTLAALLAHFAVQLNPDTNWPRSFKTVAKKFPAPHGITLENAMGFPGGWADNDLWNYDPAIR